jgi:SPP1 gp7 family putative phage head morphogenesis protein
MARDYWKDRQAKALTNLTNKSAKAIETQLRKYYKRTMESTIADFEATFDKLQATAVEGRHPTPADLYKLDKYWQAQAQLKEQLQKLGDKEAVLFSAQFEKSYNDIYRALAADSGVHFSRISTQGAEQMIKQVWAADGKSWSKRIWENTEELAAALNEKMIECVVGGKKTSDLKKALMERFGVSFSRADALARTELAHVQTQAARQRYEDTGIEYVEIWADKDERRCDVCGKLHQKRYPVNAQIPIPAHPRCRCCIVPVVEIPEDKPVQQPQPQAQPKEQPQTIAEQIKEREAQELEKVIAKNPYVIDEAELPPFPSAYNYETYEQYKKDVAKWRETHPYESAYDPYCADSYWRSTGEYADQVDKNKRFDATIAKLNKDYPLNEHNMQKIRVGSYENMGAFLTETQQERMGEAQAQFWRNPQTDEAVIGFNPFGTTGTMADDLRKRAKAIKEGKILSTVLDNSPEGVAIHEWGHGMSDYITTAMVYDCPDAHEYWDWYRSLPKEEIKAGLSSYAAENRGEFEAECFAELQTDNPRPLALEYEKYLKKCKAFCGRIKYIDSRPD